MRNEPFYPNFLKTLAKALQELQNIAILLIVLSSGLQTSQKIPLFVVVQKSFFD